MRKKVVNNDQGKLGSLFIKESKNKTKGYSPINQQETKEKYIDKPINQAISPLIKATYQNVMDEKKRDNAKDEQRNALEDKLEKVND